MVGEQRTDNIHMTPGALAIIASLVLAGCFSTTGSLGSHSGMAIWPISPWGTIS